MPERLLRTPRRQCHQSSSVFRRHWRHLQKHRRRRPRHCLHLLPARRSQWRTLQTPNSERLRSV